MAELLRSEPVQRLRSEVIMARSLAVLAVLALVAALYVAKGVLLPLALAVLLAFLLAPGVRLLRGWGVPRVPAVLFVVILAFLIISGISGLIGQQVTQLAAKLPQYQYTIERKIETVRGAASGGTFERISNFLRDLNQQIKQQSGGQPGAAPAAEPAENAPVPVQVYPPSPTPLGLIQQGLQPLLDPLTTAGLVLILVVFFLLQRQDMRDRLIRLAGSHDLQRTTEALNDAAHRLSRYFLAQTSLNVLFGAIVGTGLTFIGVPNPVLFGIIAMLLRFVPYIGAFIAAVLPTILAVAVDPGWAMALATIGLFVTVEPLIGQIIEPLVYGHSTGLTPVSVIIAAMFWTWLWGPIGLLLSTPLTVCLGVLGRHIEWLQFLDVMIGDKPPLSPAQSFYQRALAGDADEVVDQVEQMLKRRSLVACYDEVVLPALILAQSDARRGVLDPKHIEQINDVIQELVTEMAEHEDATSARRKETSRAPDEKNEGRLPTADLPVVDDPAPSWRGSPVLCITGRGPFDHAAAKLLAQLFEKHGLGTRIEPDTAVSSSNIVRLNSAGVAVVCLSYFDLGNGPAHLRHSIRRLRRQIPTAKLLACWWGREGSEAADVDADLQVRSLRQAASFCVDMALTAKADRESEVAEPAAGSTAA
jgi:predicted PurR-regulated permease PerM